MSGVNGVISNFNPNIQESWLIQRTQLGNTITVADLSVWLAKILKSPSANNQTRAICNSFLASMFKGFVVPMFERYVLVVYAREHNLDELPPLIRNPDTGRSIGNVDPGPSLGVAPE